MSGAGRHTKLFERLKELEGEFEGSLLKELQDCASGVWGLFKQNPPQYLERHLRERLSRLDELGRRSSPSDDSWPNPRTSHS